MTSIDIRTNTACTNRPRKADERRKTVLFCPVCGHESPIDGEWLVRLESGHETVVCPVCDEVLETR